LQVQRVNKTGYRLILCVGVRNFYRASVHAKQRSGILSWSVRALESRQRPFFLGGRADLLKRRIDLARRNALGEATLLFGHVSPQARSDGLGVAWRECSAARQ
jgi:hypothetical protein